MYSLKGTQGEDEDQIGHFVLFYFLFFVLLQLIFSVSAETGVVFQAESQLGMGYVEPDSTATRRKTFAHNTDSTFPLPAATRVVPGHAQTTPVSP